MTHTSEAPLPVEYKGISLDCGCRVDVLVEDAFIVELKSVQKIDPIHETQILTYMKLSGIPTSLMFNFNVTRLKDGMKGMCSDRFKTFVAFALFVLKIKKSEPVAIANT